MQTPRYRGLFPEADLDRASRDLRVAQGGELVFRAVGQALVGRGPDITIFENPLSPSDARSDQSRRALVSWFEAEFASQLKDGASSIQIVITPRMHPDDFVEYLLGGRSKWDHLSIAAIAMNDETWRLSNGLCHRRQKQEALQKGGEARDAVRARMYEVGAFNFVAQYQQDPRSIGERRFGHFSEVAGPNWTPEDYIPESFMGWILETAYLHHEIFGEGEAPPLPGAGNGLSDEQWEQSGILQQRRLLAECEE